MIAWFDVEQHHDVRCLAVERTAEPSEYLLAVDGWVSADIVALLTVNSAGEVIDHNAECRYATETELADWVRRSGWKILTYLARRPPLARDARRTMTQIRPALPLKEG